MTRAECWAVGAGIVGSAPSSAGDLWSQGLHFSISSRATDDLSPLCRALRALQVWEPPSLALLPLQFSWRSPGRCWACFSLALV